MKIMGRVHTNYLGDTYWFDKNDDYHREDGPAIICANGSKMWYIEGHLHREDGPAVLYTNGDCWWFLKGEYLSFYEYCEKLNLSSEDRLMLALRYNVC